MESEYTERFLIYCKKCHTTPAKVFEDDKKLWLTVHGFGYQHWLRQNIGLFDKIHPEHCMYGGCGLAVLDEGQEAFTEFLRNGSDIKYPGALYVFSGIKELKLWIAGHLHHREYNETMQPVLDAILRLPNLPKYGEKWDDFLNTLPINLWTLTKMVRRN